MYYLGYDIGSSSIKVALVESNTGKVAGVLREPQEEMVFVAPQQNWAEQDPELWWQYICSATKLIIKICH